MSDLNMIARFGDTEGTNVLAGHCRRIRRDDPCRARCQAPGCAAKGRGRRHPGFCGDSGPAQREPMVSAPMPSCSRPAGWQPPIKDLNVATLGGGFGLAQFPDFAGVVFRNGFMSALKDGWRPFFGKLTRMGGEGMRAAAKDYRAFGPARKPSNPHGCWTSWTPMTSTITRRHSSAPCG